MRVILQPVGDSDANRHFVDTISNPVPVARIMSLLDESQREQLEPVFQGRAAIPTWGVKPGKGDVNVGKWLRVEPGDIALFSRNKHIIASTSVAAKVHSRALALDLWHTNSDGDTWEYIYFLDELEHLNIPYALFNVAAGYEPNNVIQGFNVLSEDKSAKILDAFEIDSTRYTPSVDDMESLRERLRKRFLESEKTDAERRVTQRLEQGALKRALFGRSNRGLCAICGVEYSLDFLVVAHIKKRALCSLEERLDFRHIAAPMCRAGCDSLYELGYIVVDDAGTVAEGRQDLSSPGVRGLIDQLVGRKCPAWTPGSEPYFSWHRQRFLGTTVEVIG